MRIQFAKGSGYYKLEIGSGFYKLEIWSGFCKLESRPGFYDLKKNPDQMSWKNDQVLRKGEREKILLIWEISNLL